MEEAWNILIELYGNRDEIRIRLKLKIMNLKLKATNCYEHNIELYDALLYIHGRIKAAGALDMLESDAEYVRLVAQLLAPEDLIPWADVSNKTWAPS